MLPSGTLSVVFFPSRETISITTTALTATNRAKNPVAMSTSQRRRGRDRSGFGATHDSASDTTGELAAGTGAATLAVGVPRNASSIAASAATTSRAVGRFAAVLS